MPVAKTVARSVARNPEMLYITLRQHIYYFSRKLPDDLAGKPLVLASGIHKVGANGSKEP